MQNKVYRLSMLKKNSTLLYALGAALEYYDFIIYGLMASYLSLLFFPSSNQMATQLGTFALFALGYVVRPFGAIIFGSLGDLFNRRKVFILTNSILAITTLAISVIPTYEKIGIISSIILVILRILQSISFATELPGSMALIHDEQPNSAQKFGFVISGTSLGMIIATQIMFLLEYLYTQQEIIDFAWRFPFMLSSLLYFVSILMRKNLPNLTQEKVKDKFSLFSVVVTEYKNITIFIFLIAVFAFLVMMNIFFPSFIPKFYYHNTQEVLLAISISIVWSFFYSPIYAYMIRKYNKTSCLRTALIFTIILSFIIHKLLKMESFFYLSISLCLYQSMISNLTITTFSLMAETFPSKARMTLISLCYNLTYLLISFTPLLINNFALSFNTGFVLWGCLITLCLLALYRINNLNHKLTT